MTAELSSRLLALARRCDGKAVDRVEIAVSAVGPAAERLNAQAAAALFQCAAALRARATGEIEHG